VNGPVTIGLILLRLEVEVPVVSFKASILAISLQIRFASLVFHACVLPVSARGASSFLRCEPVCFSFSIDYRIFSYLACWNSTFFKNFDKSSMNSIGKLVDLSGDVNIAASRLSRDACLCRGIFD
jgi:hypothetical protein